MSQPWKLLPLAAVLAVIGALILAPGGVTQPQSAFAYDCDAGDTGTLRVRIIDDDTGSPITVANAIIEISPNPANANAGNSSAIISDNSNADSNNAIGVIEVEACATEGNEVYEARLIVLPNALEDCSIEDDTDTTALDSDDIETMTLFVNCEDLGTPTATATTTATPTTTVGPAATVTTNASPSTVQCTGTSIVTVQVRDAAGNPVPPGTVVSISTNLGEVSHSSGQTTDASGNAFVFFSGKGVGGTATIVAKAGNAEGSTTVTVNCGATPTVTTAPPPTVAPGGGVISPPNTGDGGLVANRDGQSWLAFAGIGLLVAAAAGAAGIAKVRA